MSFWARLFQRKQSEARVLIAMNQLGKPVMTPKNYEAFAKEGYQANVITYKCVSLLSRSLASIQWDLVETRNGAEPREVEQHPLLDLMEKPNPMQSWSGFLEAVTAYFYISGNSYIEEVRAFERQPPTELWPVRPDFMRVIPGSAGLPAAFEFRTQTGKKVFPVDQVTGRSSLLHLKTFHPTDIWYGMSPIEAAMYSIDQHNESGRWNLSMLQNEGKPSGAIIVKESAANPLGTLPPPQFENLRQQLNERHAGSKNAGRMMLLEGGMDWKQLSLTPKDMDWMEGRKMSSRDIALAFGVPPIMLNIPGDSTFSNYKEARLALYEDTLIPMAYYLRDELNKWLVPQFGDNLELQPDIDSIEAIASKRAEKFTSVGSAQFLTLNEKRIATGYQPIEGGDVVLVNSGQITLQDLQAEPTPDTVPTNNQPTPDSNNSQGNSEQNSPPNPTDDLPDVSENVVEQGAAGSTTLVAWKAVNLVTRAEKQNTWRRANAERRRLQKAMEMDVQEELEQEAAAVSRALENIEPKLWEFTAIRVIQDRRPQMQAVIRKHVNRAIRTFSAPILGFGKAHYPADYESKTLVRFNDFVRRFVDQHTASAVEQIEGTSIRKARSKIRSVISDALGQEEIPNNQQIAKELRTELEGLSPGRARTIARTEVVVASNQGSLEAAKALDLPGMQKEWVSVQDDRTRDNDDVANHYDMNGARVGLDEDFVVPPDTSMKSPADPSAPAAQVVNCRCIMTFAVGS